jgi:hypothetical protein
MRQHSIKIPFNYLEIVRPAKKKQYWAQNVSQFFLRTLASYTPYGCRKHPWAFI